MSLSPDKFLKLPLWIKSAGVLSIGFDFGTHSTKIVIRERDNSTRRFVLVLDDAIQGYPWFASPSLVRIAEDGGMFFGTRAARIISGMLYRSLKMELLPPPRQHRPSSGEKPPPTPDFLVATYFAWLFGRIHRSLPPDPKRRILLNVAAPMNSVTNPELTNRYLRVINAAWEATFSSSPIVVGQGSRLDELEPAIHRMLDSPVPPPAMRTFDVRPETLAPLVSLITDPRVEKGMCLLVDMGAGTTEVSISHVGGYNQDHQLLCYYDVSNDLGGDDYGLLENLPPSERIATATALDDKLYHLIRTVWYKGYMKDMDAPAARPHWSRLRTLLTGGGLRRGGLVQGIDDLKLPRRIFSDRYTSRSAKWHEPSELEFSEQREPGCNEDSHAFLAVADGLSTERRR